MAKTRHYRKRTTRNKRRHNKRTRKHKRGGQGSPKPRGTVGRTDGPKRELNPSEYYNFGNGPQREYEVNAPFKPKKNSIEEYYTFGDKPGVTEEQKRNGMR